MGRALLLGVAPETMRYFPFGLTLGLENERRLSVITCVSAPPSKSIFQISVLCEFFALRVTNNSLEDLPGTKQGLKF
jgi:hypothetical protein